MSAQKTTKKPDVPSKETTPESSPTNNNAPKYGTVIPNRVFVGGISSSTTEPELTQLFSSYGKVVNTKIIVDRAGVSKGYGFVTFDSEEEAKKLQKDADNIVLRERKLNIAPAIKKQNFNRQYETPSPASSVPAAQIYHQNGVPFSFHNGTAFFSPTNQTSAPLAPIQTAPVDHSMYSSGFGNATPHVTYTPSMVYSTPMFFQTPQYTQYPVPYDGCYTVGDGQGSIILQNNGPNAGGGAEGSVMQMPPPQYFLTQPTPPPPYSTPAEVATYIHPQFYSAEMPHHILFRRPYEQNSVMELQSNGSGGVQQQSTGGPKGPPPRPGDGPSVAEMRGGPHPPLPLYQGDGPGAREGREMSKMDNSGEKGEKRSHIPVVSIMKLDNEERSRFPPKPNFHPPGPPGKNSLNNNNTEAANRNLVPKHFKHPSPPPAPYNPMIRPYHGDNPRFNGPSTPQVPHFPYYHTQNPRSMYGSPTHSQPRRFPNPPPNAAQKRQPNGGNRGRGKNGGQVKNGVGGGLMQSIEDSPPSNTLTPPTTPRCSPQDSASSDQTPPTQAIQALAIQ